MTAKTLVPNVGPIAGGQDPPVTSAIVSCFKQLVVSL